MKTEIKPNSRHNDIVIQEIADETLIYDLLDDRAFCLNETSSLIWQMCDGTKTVSEIADQLSKKLKSLVSEDVVWLAIDQLNKDGLLEDNSIEIEKFTGMSRREVIRKVGLTSAIALPIISSMVVPTALAASSDCTPGSQPCDFNTPCCPGSSCQEISSGIGFCFPNNLE